MDPGSKRRRSFRVFAGAALFAAVVLASSATATINAAGTDSSQVGSWSDPVPLGIIGIHAALLPSGKVLYYELPSTRLSRARVFDPVTGASEVVDPNLDWSVFCSGMSILADGRVFATGGEPPRTAIHPVGTGIENAAFFDPGTHMWAGAPRMAYARWYPTNVTMPDGTVLVMGGETAPTGSNKLVKPMESFDPDSGTWTTLPISAYTTGLYPRALLLPDGQVVNAGPQRTTKVYTPATKSWAPVSSMLYGARQAGGVVLLSDLTTVLASGGIGSGHPVTSTSELLDMSAPSPHWVSTGSMGIARQHHNLVLLPDGNVLAVGGGQQGNFGTPVKTAELYDAAAGTWSTMATQAGPRMYHSTALLLPDGRVISAGSNTKTTFETTVEIYSPPYLFRGPRPTVTSAPSSITYAGSFDVETPDAPSITGVALVRLGTTTHGFAADQRDVPLDFTVDAGVLHVSAPANAARAPAGPYMLFILNGDGVPSVAPTVFLG